MFNYSWFGLRMVRVTVIARVDCDSHTRPTVRKPGLQSESTAILTVRYGQLESTSESGLRVSLTDSQPVSRALSGAPCLRLILAAVVPKFWGAVSLSHSQPRHGPGGITGTAKRRVGDSESA